MLKQNLKLIGLILVCTFFLLSGVDLLISAYRLNNPFTFVMVFFASNLMILISAALGLGFALRLRHQRRAARPPRSVPPQQP